MCDKYKALDETDCGKNKTEEETSGMGDLK
jgi:hypothetical protein